MTARQSVNFTLEEEPALGPLNRNSGAIAASCAQVHASSLPDTAAVGLRANDLLNTEPILLTGQPWKRDYDLMSPLRYPGSKRKMVPALRALIEGNVPRPKLFVEPFCGGASVSLGLLELDVVDSVVLADLDPLIAAFWRVAIFDTQSLIDAMHREPVTVRNWEHWVAREPRSDLWKAVKCLFLNRTTFSGILGEGAGPIGGRKQLSKYKIDCRFDKLAIERRIRNVAQLGLDGRILGVVEGSWQKTMWAAGHYGLRLEDHEILLYLDPPYVKQAKRLYGKSFGEADHRHLAATLTRVTRHRWILSYDDEPLVEELYGSLPDVRKFVAAHSYTMQGRRRVAPVPGREVIFTNLPVKPFISEVCP